MVTHTQTRCSAFNPNKVHTHSSEHTHTVNTHPEQWAAIYAAAPGEQLGVWCLAQGHLGRGIEGGESAGHSLPHRQSLPARDSNPQPFDYESDSLTIRPQLPLKSYMIIRNKSVIKDFTFSLEKALLWSMDCSLARRNSLKVQHSIVLLHQKPSNHLYLFWLVIDAWSVHISLLIQKRLLLNWRK